MASSRTVCCLGLIGLGDFRFRASKGVRWILPGWLPEFILLLTPYRYIMCGFPSVSLLYITPMLHSSFYGSNKHGTPHETPSEVVPGLHQGMHRK